jgi:hypothetical protein
MPQLILYCNSGNIIFETKECSKPLRRENESHRPRERKTLGMEGKGREKKDLIANCMYIDFVYLHDGIQEQQL